MDASDVADAIDTIEPGIVEHIDDASVPRIELNARDTASENTLRAIRAYVERCEGWSLDTQFQAGYWVVEARAGAGD